MKKPNLKKTIAGLCVTAMLGGFVPASASAMDFEAYQQAIAEYQAAYEAAVAQQLEQYEAAVEAYREADGFNVEAVFEYLISLSSPEEQKQLFRSLNERQRKMLVEYMLDKAEKGEFEEFFDSEFVLKDEIQPELKVIRAERGIPEPIEPEETLPEETLPAEPEDPAAEEPHELTEEEFLLTYYPDKVELYKEHRQYAQLNLDYETEQRIKAYVDEKYPLESVVTEEPVTEEPVIEEPSSEEQPDEATLEESSAEPSRDEEGVRTSEMTDEVSPVAEELSLDPSALNPAEPAIEVPSEEVAAEEESPIDETELSPAPSILPPAEPEEALPGEEVPAEEIPVEEELPEEPRELTEEEFLLTYYPDKVELYKEHRQYAQLNLDYETEQRIKVYVDEKYPLEPVVTEEPVTEEPVMKEPSPEEQLDEAAPAEPSAEPEEAIPEELSDEEPSMDEPAAEEPAEEEAPVEEQPAEEPSLESEEDLPLNGEDPDARETRDDPGLPDREAVDEVSPAAADEAPAEPIVEAPSALPPEKTVTILSSLGDTISLGEPVTLTGVLEDADEFSDVIYIWEVDKGTSTYEEVADAANASTYSFPATVESLSWNWRLRVLYR